MVKFLFVFFPPQVLHSAVHLKRSDADSASPYPKDRVIKITLKSNFFSSNDMMSQGEESSPHETLLSL